MDGIPNLEKMLGKKTTFEEAVKRLTVMMEEDYTCAGQQNRVALYKAVCRAATLLKSRYTAKSFWMLGARLFHASSVVVETLEQRTHMEQCLASANEFLGEFDAPDQHDDDTLRPGAGRAAAQPFHFEGQLTSGAPPQPLWLIEQRAGLEMITAIQQQQAAPPTDPASRSRRPAPTAPRSGAAAEPEEVSPSVTSDSDEIASETRPVAAGGVEREGHGTGEELAQEGGEEVEGEGGQRGLFGRSERARWAAAVEGLDGEDGPGNLQQLLALLQSRVAAMDEASEEMRGLEEAIQASLASEPIARNVRPPASKEEVHKLATFEVTKEWLEKEQEGSATAPRCPICMEDLAEGQVLQRMPCRHCFHPDCLLGWLKDNNSCPLCLFEMPTDDSEYERRKEREREEAEERRGAENALRGGESMFI
eukprot:TRINITY_DN22511_c0_g1_i1.p1 TRINITY_DN22511_c0_g1~~TRINITY_DN22511_c0_g1_i1.p1  ORF type:complete len:421 (-),score=93.27 TRINITY_DN22511_c0_g1_i1:465-1727(-)